MATLVSLLICLLGMTVVLATDVDNPGSGILATSSTVGDEQEMMQQEEKMAEQQLRGETTPSPTIPTSVSPYREEAARLMEAFELELQRRRQEFKRRLEMGDTRLIDVENLSGFADVVNKLKSNKEYNLPKEVTSVHNNDAKQAQKEQVQRQTPTHDNNQINADIPEDSKQQNLGHTYENEIIPDASEQYIDNSEPNEYDYYKKHDRYFEKPKYEQYIPRNFFKDGQSERHEHYREPPKYKIWEVSPRTFDNDDNVYYNRHEPRYPVYKLYHENSIKPMMRHELSEEDSYESDDYYDHQEERKHEKSESEERDVPSQEVYRRSVDRKTYYPKYISVEEDRYWPLIKRHRQHRLHYELGGYSDSSSSSSSSSENESDERPSLSFSKPRLPEKPKKSAPKVKRANRVSKDMMHTISSVFKSIPRKLAVTIHKYDPKQHNRPVQSPKQAIPAFYNGTQRMCYQCSWFHDKNKKPGESQYIEDRCRYAFHHNDAAIFGIQTISCVDNCYVRVDPDNSVHRGCYRGDYGVNPQSLGCHKQGVKKSVYCFCWGAKCNNSNSPAFF